MATVPLHAKADIWSIIPFVATSGALMFKIKVYESNMIGWQDSCKSLRVAMSVTECIQLYDAIDSFSRHMFICVQNISIIPLEFDCGIMVPF